MKYPLTFFVDNLPNNMGGKVLVYWPIATIRILGKYRDDEGIYQHELLHVKQFYCTLGLHCLLYKFVPEYKLWAEVEAYKKQLKYYPDDKSELFAEFISTRYGLKVAKEYALWLLKQNG